MCVFSLFLSFLFSLLLGLTNVVAMLQIQGLQLFHLEDLRLHPFSCTLAHSIHFSSAQNLITGELFFILPLKLNANNFVSTRISGFIYCPSVSD
jgi:hypothetical protein